METINQIKVDEGGYQAEVYLCSEGKLTWLYGRNIEDRPITDFEYKILSSNLAAGYTQKDWACILFKNETYELFLNLKDNYGIDMESFCGEIQSILINMSYNMGLTKFNPIKWPNFFKAIKEQNWKQAAIEGRDSKWFNQVGQRSVRLMNSLENVI